MGRHKDWLIEQEDRGWWDGPDTHVCGNCFDDALLSEIARDNAEAFECDYCGATADESGNPESPIAAPFKTLMEVIAHGLYKEWNGADSEGIPYESREGGYQFPTIDTWDLVSDHVPIDDDDLRRDIVNSLPDQHWCERDFARLAPAQSMALDWERFCDIVKHEHRYVFAVHSQSNGRPEYAEPAADYEPNADEIWRQEEDARPSPSELLEMIGRIVVSADLMRNVPVGARFKRARIHTASRLFRSPEALGTPPPLKVRYANRMSPAGIPMFYGALDGYTAVAETKTRKLDKSEIVSVAEFMVSKEFWVIDFSRLPPIPSLFSELSRWERGAIIFLHRFVEDLSKPVKRDGREHIEYVPTQIVTEYFRYAFNPDSERRVRGLYYPSSRVPDGVACVLFFDREACGSQPESRWSKSEQWLRLNVHSIQRRRGRPMHERPRSSQQPMQATLLPP
jgi:hypothetical protein